MLREEIFTSIQQGGGEFKQALFHGLQIRDEEKEAILSSLSGGHHLLILGPPGCGKTVVANRLSSILADIEVVEDCPLNCLPSSPTCPWCLAKMSQGKSSTVRILPASERVKRVQGGGELVPEDLIGALDPDTALREGIYSVLAFSPGKLLRANRGILLIDMIDRMPERVLNTLFYALEGGTITIGAYDEKIPLDILVLATGNEKVLGLLPLGILEYFDVITLGYVDDATREKELVLANLAEVQPGEMLAETIVDKAVDVVGRTRTHAEVDRGVSTRGTLRYTELMSTFQEIKDVDEGELLRAGAFPSLPHRLELAPHADLPGKREKIIEEILDQVLGAEGEEEISLSKEDMLALVEEIASDAKFRIPLRSGAFDMLLKRVQYHSDSKLAQLMQQMMQRLEELYPERFRADNITEEMLLDLDEVRKREERIERMRRELEREALAQSLEYLERCKILEHTGFGWELSRKGINLLLERLTPKLWGRSYVSGYGRHSTGKRLSIGEGREVGTRHFRFGDRYRDISLKESIREAIHNRREEITKDDIMVATKDIRAKMDMILLVDLSGTMRQLAKLWYAKQSAIALSLAASRYGDRVGVVSFSNLAGVVVDITANPHRLTRRIIDLDLHVNAFTNIGYGIMKATELFGHHRRGRANQHIILISDGDANVPHPSPQKYALRQAAGAARKGITISTVCINEESADPELMRRIARIGKGRTYFVGAESLTSTLIEERMAAHSSG